MNSTFLTLIMKIVKKCFADAKKSTFSPNDKINTHLLEISLRRAQQDMMNQEIYSNYVKKRNTKKSR